MQWFINRLNEGYVLVRNPFNYNQVSRIRLDDKVLDFIVFWTKDPTELVNRAEELRDYKYYVQVTINPYNTVIERNVPRKDKIIDSFIRLSKLIGRERVIWRYDPIILNRDMDVEYHYKYFEKLVARLCDYTEKCIISFIDFYPKIEKNMRKLDCRDITRDEMYIIGERFSAIARKYGISIQTCSEEVDLSSYGIGRSKCIDDQLISRILGQTLALPKDKNQRDVCGCVESVDIGAYNTCKHGCLYCYANYSEASEINNIKKHDMNSPMLIGNVEAKDKITDRRVESILAKQLNFFDL